MFLTHGQLHSLFSASLGRTLRQNCRLNCFHNSKNILKYKVDNTTASLKDKLSTSSSRMTPKRPWTIRHAMQALGVRFSFQCICLRLMLTKTLNRFFPNIFNLVPFVEIRIYLVLFLVPLFFFFSYNNPFSSNAHDKRTKTALSGVIRSLLNNEIWSTCCQQGLHTTTMATRTSQICKNLDFCTLCRLHASDFHFATFL